jgi:hypothetical protein
VTGDIGAAALERYRVVVQAKRAVLDVVDYEMPADSSFTNRLLTLPFRPKEMP